MTVLTAMPTADVEVGGLIAKGITKSYRRGMWPRRRELAVLRGADFDVGAGEVVGLVGENGSGKSTLMKILVGALAADSGTINVTGRMGYCPQEPVLYDRLTCEEHLELFGVAYVDTPVPSAMSAGRWCGRAVCRSWQSCVSSPRPGQRRRRRTAVQRVWPLFRPGRRVLLGCSRRQRYRWSVRALGRRPPPRYRRRCEIVSQAKCS